MSLNSYKVTNRYPVKDKETNNNIKVIVLDGVKDDYETIKQGLTEKDALIIIDEADMVFNRYVDLIKICILNVTSKFIIIARSAILGMHFSYSEHACIEGNYKSIKIKYYNEE